MLVCFQTGCNFRRTLLVLAAVTCLCASPLQSAQKDDLPPPLFGEGYLPQRTAALTALSLGDTAPLRQAILFAAGDAMGFWELESPLRGESLTPYGAASVLLASVPGNAPGFNTSLMLEAGDAFNCWSLEDPTRFRWLDRNVLASVMDNQPLPGPTGRTRTAVEEAYIFQDALLKVLRIHQEAFERVANHDITVEVIDEAPVRFRGHVVKFDGRLRRIRQVDAPPALKQFGAAKLYDVWMTVQSGPISRLVRVLTPLSFNIAPTEDPPVAVELTVVGYYFKKVPLGKGEAVPGQPERSVPLVLGHVIPFIGHEVRLAAGAFAIVGAASQPVGGPLGGLLAFRTAERTQNWVLGDPSRVPPLDPRYIDAVKDSQTLPFNFDVAATNEKDQKDQEEKLREVFAYYDAVIKAERFGLDLFRASLKKNVTFAHLHNEPQNYRGDVVQISGKLRRVRQFEPSVYEKREGVKQVYEVWLVDDEYKMSPPAVLICTQLPPGVPVAEKVKGSPKVSFVGYFFKKYLYKPADAKKEKEFRVAPLIIGHLIADIKKPGEKGSGWADALAPLILVALAGTFVIVFLMTWLFRRADRHVLAKVDASAPPFTITPEPETPPSADAEAFRPPDG